MNFIDILFDFPFINPQKNRVEWAENSGEKIVSERRFNHRQGGKENEFGTFLCNYQNKKLSVIDK